MPIARCTNPECINKDYVVILDVNIITGATEAFAKKILDDQQGTPDQFLQKLEIFFAALCRCTLDGVLHTTDLVWQEFKPERNTIWQTYHGSKPHFGELKSRLDRFLKKWNVGYDVVAETRTLPPVPKSERATPEPNDLTLLALALNKRVENTPVMVATMDEALYDLMRRISTLRNLRWKDQTLNGSLIGYQTGLICVEGAHRCCHITTDDFRIFQNHALTKDMERMATILDVGKKQAKIRDHVACVNAMAQSVAVKAMRRAALQTAR